MEAQGTYQNIVNSGIDSASLLAQSKANDIGTIETLGRNSSLSSSHSIDSMKSLAAEVQSNEPNAQSELITKLEESSKGKIKGSLLLKYLQSAKQPKMLAFLIASSVGSQILASGADFWAGFW